MSLNLNSTKVSSNDFSYGSLRAPYTDNPIVLVVKDQDDRQAEMLTILDLSGYAVIDTDNGQDAAKRARYVYPDLVLIDLDVPLLYEIVAARQIVKNAQLGIVPIVIVTRDREVDSAAILELGVRRNEYVTRLSDYDDYDELENLLDYLLPLTTPTGKADRVFKQARTTQ